MLDQCLHKLKHLFVGWSCFAWNNANFDNKLIDRRSMEAAGALAVTTTLTGQQVLLKKSTLTH